MTMRYQQSLLMHDQGEKVPLYHAGHHPDLSGARLSGLGDAHVGDGRRWRRRPAAITYNVYTYCTYEYDSLGCFYAKRAQRPKSP